MAEIRTMTKREAAILYRMQARDHEGAIKILGDLTKLPPGMEQAYQETADYSDGIAWELEKDPDGTIEVEMSLLHPLDVVRFREQACEKYVTKPFLGGLRDKGVLP